MLFGLTRYQIRLIFINVDTKTPICRDLDALILPVLSDMVFKAPKAFLRLAAPLTIVLVVPGTILEPEVILS